MIESDRPKLTVHVAAMLLAFRCEASEPALLGYWIGLNDLPIDAVIFAIGRAIRELDHAPAPVEIRRLAGEDTGEQRAIRAWNAALSAIGLGSYKHVDFEDCVINATIRNLGGWPTFLSRFADAESEKWLRIEFLKAYAVFGSGNALSLEAVAALPGLSEVDFSSGELGKPIARRIPCDYQIARPTIQFNAPAIELTPNSR